MVVVAAAVVEMVVAVAETLVVATAVAALPQCNSRGRSYQQPLPPKFPLPFFAISAANAWRLVVGMRRMDGLF
jgi:hypothetical protein